MDSFTHKCPNCGGPLLFDPKDQKFHCEFCLNVYTEEEVSTYEQAQREAHLEDPAVSRTEPTPTSNSTIGMADAQLGPSSATVSEEAVTPQTASDSQHVDNHQTVSDQDGDADAEPAMEVFLCGSCGAEIVTDATTAATYCYYCHNPVVLSGRLSGTVLPDRVLPFSIEKEKAIEQFLAWTKKKWFIPKDFFNKQQIEKLTGVYFPYWTVDSKISGSMNAKGTRIKVWRIGDIEYTETKQFAVGRKGKLTFKDFLQNALSKNTRQKMIEGVQPFPLEQATAFKSQYLAGFQAEKRDIEYSALKEQVNQALEEYSTSLLKEAAIGYTTLTNVQGAISIDQQNADYVLLPIWLVTYRTPSDPDKVYYYAMNGRTGKVNGVLPLSRKRLGLFSLGLFVGLLALFLLGGYLL